jgi:hypothetical protein
MPSRKRITMSQVMFGTKACASASTTNMIIVTRNITRRPILSESQPPINAPARHLLPG